MNWPKFIEDYRTLEAWLVAEGYDHAYYPVIAVISAVMRGNTDAEDIIRETLAKRSPAEVPESVYNIISRWQFCVPKDPAFLGEFHQRISHGRKAQGLYYTPQEVIDFILQQTVAQYNIIENPFFKILDPACGCGYFLLRAYDLLWTAYQKSRTTLTEKYPSYDWSDNGVHAHIISNNLWGADIDAEAVYIARTGLLLKRPEMFSVLKPNVLTCDSLKSLHELNLLSESKQFWSGKYEFVIGNPPYLSFGLRGTARLDPDYADYLRQVYKETAEYKISYYVLFMQRGLELLADGGKLGFIVPDSFLLGRYFSKIRRYILDHAAINTLAYIAKPVFKQATVGISAICVLTREREAEKRDSQLIDIYQSRSAALLNQAAPVFRVTQGYYNSLAHNRFRLFFDLTAKKLIDKMESVSLPLGNFVSGHTGIRSLTKQSDIIADSKVGPCWQPGLISGRQVIRYDVEYRDYWLDIDAGKLYRGGWNPDIVGQRKILLRQTGYSLTAAIDEQGYYHLNNIHSFVLRNTEVTLDYLLVLLNSRLMAFYYHITSMEYGRVLAQTDIETIELLPVMVHQDICRQAPGLVKAMMDYVKRGVSGDSEAEAKAKAVDEYFNQLVYRIYGLTDQEIAYIEKFESTNAETLRLPETVKN